MWRMPLRRISLRDQLLDKPHSALGDDPPLVALRPLHTCAAHALPEGVVVKYVVHGTEKGIDIAVFREIGYAVGELQERSVAQGNHRGATRHGLDDWHAES